MELPARILPVVNAGVDSKALLVDDTSVDSVPCLVDQALAQDWKAGVFDFGKAEGPNIDHFNPGLVQRPDGLWLLVRRAVFANYARWGQNSVWAFKLNEDKVPQFGKMLKFLAADAREQFEDPRAIFHAGRTWVGACNFLFFGEKWTGAHQTLGVFNEDWSCHTRYHPEIGGNGSSLRSNTRHEKNWPWFFHEDRLHLLYQANPWEVYQFGTRWDERVTHTAPGLQWDYGEIRGGTPPVRVDDLYWTFFHSSVPWEGAYRRYYMGALAFEVKAPFNPVRITKVPMLAGSAHDRWNNRKPPCVFPCGAVLRDNTWLVTYGVNDLNCGWVEIPHNDLLRLAAPISSVAPIKPLDTKLSSTKIVGVVGKRRIKRRKL